MILGMQPKVYLFDEDRGGRGVNHGFDISWDFVWHPLYLHRCMSHETVPPSYTLLLQSVSNPWIISRNIQGKIIARDSVWTFFWNNSFAIDIISNFEYIPINFIK